MKSIEGRIEFGQSELDSILDRIITERAEVLKALDSADEQVKDLALHAPWLAEFLDVEEKFWKTRFQALAGAGLVERKNALDVYNDILQTVTAWMQIGQLIAGESLKEGSDNSKAPDVRAQMSRLLRLQSHLRFAVEELDGASMSVFSVLDSIADTAITIWDTELYLAEDTASLDGQRVTPYRAITLGKLVWLAFILTVGWFVLRYLSRQAKNIRTSPPGGNPRVGRFHRQLDFWGGACVS